MTLNGVEITTTASLAEVVATIQPAVQPKAVAPIVATPQVVQDPVQVKPARQPKAAPKPSAPKVQASTPKVARPPKAAKRDNKALLAEIRDLAKAGQFDAAIRLTPEGWTQVVAEVERKRAGHTPTTPQPKAAPVKSGKPMVKSQSAPKIQPKAEQPAKQDVMAKARAAKAAKAAARKGEATGRALAEGKPGDKPLVQPKAENTQQTMVLPAKLDTAEQRLHDLYESVKVCDLEAFAANLDAVASKAKDRLKLLDSRKAMLVGLKADERFAREQDDVFLQDELKARCAKVAASVRRITDELEAETAPKATV
jgi:hypothetical protein